VVVIRVAAQVLPFVQGHICHRIFRHEAREHADDSAGYFTLPNFWASLG
jgi:hypothetical protein